MIGLKFAEKTTGMKKIKVICNTSSGVKKVEGELLEWNGFQFCLAGVKNEFLAIELSTGGSVFFSYGIKSLDDVRNMVLENLEKEGVESLTEIIERFKKEYPEFTYPVNEPVK